MSGQHPTSTPPLSYTTQKERKILKSQFFYKFEANLQNKEKKRFLKNGIHPEDHSSTIAIPTSLMAPDLIFDCITHHFLKCAPVEIETPLRTIH